ncbi:sporulation protein Cse60 [uncultured Traorella sp.]|uniref:sporulation protein Cse60 n=1 Tax=uncultured Traorella sp. TaxID=1929048 RepID=UPI0025F98C51|nr:sporulation protein Cse60 [uncultured Traorella sp.]
MKVKCIDEQHENDLTMVINEFIKDKKVIDIKFSNACFKNNDEQIYCFSALILYEE